MALLGLVLMGGGMPRQNVFMLTGTVVDTGGHGIGGVVVNDGVGFAVTDSAGRWKLRTDTFNSKFISISVPAAYRLPHDGALAAGFFVPVGEAVDRRGCHFVLERRTVPADSFCYVAISDPQMRDASELAMWCRETVASLRRTLSSVGKRREVVGMVLGDVVFDNMKLFDAYAATVRNLGMTLFHCIGNHDFDKRLPSLHNSLPGVEEYAEQQYCSRFGPTDYSFNIGRAHVVTLGNIDYQGNGRYVERLTENQLKWLERDLSYVAKGSLVILNMHAPGWNREWTAANMRNADRLAAVLRGYNVHVFCGHTHFFQNAEVRRGLYQHNIGAASGAWWGGDANRCGAPRGYMVVDVCGDSLTWTYEAAEQHRDNVMRVYAPGEFKGLDGCVVANVWDCDSRTKVEWLLDGKRMGKMERFVGTDFNCGVSKDKTVPSAHLFKCRPGVRSGKVTVVVTDRFGRQSRSEVAVTSAVRRHISAWNGRL